jgi:FtsZ-interacting cell division protein ZipA
MIEFLKFWGRCAVDGWEIGDGIINFIGIIALLVSGFLLLRKSASQFCSPASAARAFSRRSRGDETQIKIQSETPHVVSYKK